MLKGNITRLLSLVQILFLLPDQQLQDLFILVQEVLLFIRNQQLELLRNLCVVDLHANLDALWVSFFSKILVVTSKEGEIKVRIIERINWDFSIPIVFRNSNWSFSFTLLDDRLFVNKVLKGREEGNFSFYSNRFILP